MPQYTEPSLVQTVACHLCGANALSEPVMAYYQLDSKEDISIKYQNTPILFQENPLENSHPLL